VHAWHAHAAHPRIRVRARAKTNLRARVGTQQLALPHGPCRLTLRVLKPAAGRAQGAVPFAPSFACEAAVRGSRRFTPRPAHCLDTHTRVCCGCVRVRRRRGGDAAEHHLAAERRAGAGAVSPLCLPTASPHCVSPTVSPHCVSPLCLPTVSPSLCLPLTCWWSRCARWRCCSRPFTPRGCSRAGEILPATGFAYR
jgi:hypothetical protein